MNQIQFLSLQNKDKSLKIVNVCLNKVQLENIIRRQEEELRSKDQRVKSLQILLKERTQKINKMNVTYFQMEEEITQQRRSVDIQSIQQQKISEQKISKIRLQQIIRFQQEEIQNYMIDHAQYLQFIEQIYQSNHVWFEERTLLYEYREELQNQVQQVENINQALIQSNYQYETQLNQQNEQGNDLLGQIQYMIECCEGKNQAKPQKIQHDNPNQQNDQKTEEEQQNYYNEYCKLHLANVVLTTQLKELNFEKNQLIGKLLKLEKKAQELSDGNSGQVDQKKRRIRRAASQIARHYKCNIQGCSKSYGSEGSLNQHIKIKHPQIFKTMGHYVNSIVKESHEEDSS